MKHQFHRPPSPNYPQLKNRLIDKAAKNQGSAGWDDFRTFRWEEVFKYPEVVLRQMKQVLAAT